MRPLHSFLTALATLLFSLTAAAQVDAPYLPDSLIGTTITLKPKAKLYSPNNRQLQLIHQAASNNLYFNFIVDPSYCKTKTLSKSQALELGGFIKTQKSIDYDYYCVLNKGILYFVNPDDVLDNQILEDKNFAIRQWYASLQGQLDSLKGEYDAAYIAKLNEVKAGKALAEFKSTKLDSLSQELFQQRLNAQLTPMEEKFRKWYDNLEPSAKKYADVIAINRAALASPNSAGGCDFNLEFTNMSKKTIKYLDWYGAVYNAVGDKVGCTIRDTYSFAGRVTGPLEYKHFYGGNWDSIIYNYSAKELRLTKVVIIYMDGSQKSLSGAALNGIIGAPECSLQDWDVSFIEKHAKDDTRSQIWKEKKLWQEREDFLNKIADRKDPPSNDKEFFESLLDLKKQVTDKEEEIAKFEDRNFIQK